MTLLFSVGGLLVAGVVISSYLNNLNYACGNVVWPIVPMLLLSQAGALGQWLLARQHEPLWIQFLPAVATALAGMLLFSLFIRVSHPTLAGWWPLHSNRRLIGSLLEGSFWVYLLGLGNAIYRSTDALLINAGSHFPAGTYSGYDTNYRLCDVTVSLAVTAGYVSMPKITQWLASPDAGEQARGRLETRRLNQFQALLGIAAALAYLGGNSLFMKIWWWHRKTVVAPAPLLLQLAFALNMAVTASGDAGQQTAIRAGPQGLRLSGMLFGIMALVNLGLSLAAMRAGWLVGIAMATVVAQSLQNLLSSAYACRRLHLAWPPWVWRAWVLPVTVVLLAGWLRLHVPLSTPEHGVSAANVLILVGKLCGPRARRGRIDRRPARLHQGGNGHLAGFHPSLTKSNRTIPVVASPARSAPSSITPGKRSGDGWSFRILVTQIVAAPACKPPPATGSQTHSATRPAGNAGAAGVGNVSAQNR